MARVAVLGADGARQFFPDGNAVGSRMRIAGIEFTVVGVLAANGAGPGGISMDNLVYVPIQTSRRRVLNREHLDLISAKLVDAQRWPTTQRAIAALVRRRHGLQGAQLNDFRASSPESMIARVTDVNTTLRKALLAVGALALAIGGAVVANLMFAAATSRQREIATRRAVGATRAAVMRLFWAEAIMVSLIAGVAGLGLALAVVRAGATMMRMEMAMSWSTAVGSALLAVFVGVLAGYYPARKAASVSPAVALREPG
jgi:putative ABC transport system permease protein